MALKMVITGANVTHQTSNGFTVTQKIDPAATLDILGVPFGDDMRVMQPFAELSCPQGVQGNGYIGLEVFNSSNDSVLALEWKGKLGQLYSVLESNRAQVTAQLAVGDVESVDEGTEFEGAKGGGNVIMSPTNYSTGKLRLTFSGKIPAGSSVILKPSVDHAAMTVGDILGMPGLSGHAEVEINFSVVTV